MQPDSIVTILILKIMIIYVGTKWLIPIRIINRTIKEALFRIVCFDLFPSQVPHLLTQLSTLYVDSVRIYYVCLLFSYELQTNSIWAAVIMHSMWSETRPVESSFPPNLFLSPLFPFYVPIAPYFRESQERRPVLSWRLPSMLCLPERLGQSRGISPEGWRQISWESFSVASWHYEEKSLSLWVASIFASPCSP